MSDGPTGVVAVGLDGGGTATRALILDRHGFVLGEAAGSACSLAAMPVEDALRSAIATIRAAVDSAGVSVGDVGAVCAGVAGVSVESARLRLEQELGRLFPGARVSAVADYRVAFTGALAGEPGVIVISGTGSIAYGEDADGRGQRSGGYGYLIDDSGSGWSVGRAALAAALSAADGSGAPTAITESVLRATTVQSPREIVAAVYNGSLDRVAIAGLARLVSQAALAGDSVACEILVRAAQSLADLAAKVIGPLFGDGPVTVATAGGLWQAGDALVRPFEIALHSRYSSAKVCPAIGRPVQGAAQRALGML